VPALHAAGEEGLMDDGRVPDADEEQARLERETMLTLLQETRRAPNMSNPHIIELQAKVHDFLSSIGEA
jgi:hypothetical protein